MTTTTPLELLPLPPSLPFLTRTKTTLTENSRAYVAFGARHNESRDESLPHEDLAACDSVTHINIYNHGQTDVGRKLSHFSYSPFSHLRYGNFNSMEGFWYYIRAAHPDEELRELHGHKAKTLGKTLEILHVPNFKDLIEEANFYRIDQNPTLRAQVEASTLPFEHYYLDGPDKIVKRPRNMIWLVDGFERIRAHLKHGTRPKPVLYTS